MNLFADALNYAYKANFNRPATQEKVPDKYLMTKLLISHGNPRDGLFCSTPTLMIASYHMKVIINNITPYNRSLARQMLLIKQRRNVEALLVEVITY